MMEKNDIAKAVNEAKMVLYSEEEDNFDKMVNLFEKGGLKLYPDNMAQVVLATFEKMESDDNMSNEELAAVGMAIVAMVTSDLHEMQVIEGLNSDIVQVAMQNTIAKWMEANEDRSGFEDGIKKMSEDMKMRKQQGGGQEQQQQMGTQAPTGGMLGAV